ALTSITIVLITFAVLCFTSATRYLETTSLPAGVKSSHAGIMLRQRGFRPMSPDVAESVRALVPGRSVVERWWNANPWDPKDVIHLTSSRPTPTETPRLFPAVALLGL